MRNILYLKQIISMEAIWNHAHLERPPNTSCRIDRKIFDATAFSSTLEKVIKELTSQEFLHKEAAILSRLIYCMKCKFRNDKGLKAMSKVNRALLNYLTLSLEKEYENLKGFVEINDMFVTLPTKQMVEYVLIKTQGFAKLMLRVEETSKHSAHLLKCRMATGHVWRVALIAYAVVSRIWILSRYLVKRSCVWYNDLYKYLKLLHASGSPWLSKQYEFTSDLKSWLSVPWIEEPIPRVPSDYGLKNTMFRLITPREYGTDDDLIYDMNNHSKGRLFETETLLKEEKNAVHRATEMIENYDTVPDDDTGELIDRNVFNSKRIENAALNTKKQHKKYINTERIKEETTSSRNSNLAFHFKSAADETSSIKKEKAITAKAVNSIRKNVPKNLFSFDDVKNKSDMMLLLNKKSYPGLDKLQWNIIRNKSKKLLDKLEANDTKQSIIFKKVMKHIKTYIK